MESYVFVYSALQLLVYCTVAMATTKKLIWLSQEA
jgi:hypothetical protein